MAFFDELTKKAKDVAAVAADRAKDAAEVAKAPPRWPRSIWQSPANSGRLIRITVPSAEWFVSEYEGQIPDAVRELVDAVTASKAKIAELEASKPAREEEPVVEVSMQKKCPICGAESDSKFCPHCGAPMGE